MVQNLIALSVNISRAYEIAKAGGHSMAIIFNQETAKADCIELKMQYNAETLRAYYEAGESLQSDIVVELHNIDSTQIIASYSNRFETMGDINERVEACKKSEVEPEIKLAGANLSLLKSATDKLNLSIWQVNSILAVSQTIAKLSFSKEVKPEHLAEAIQYQSF